MKRIRAFGIKATPDLFETVWSGAAHPQLPRPVKDTVLMSAGDRYETLVDRVEAGFGKFDAGAARALMDPPVCMDSNIQSVLFAPDTLDFWVANADSENVASRTRYTKYNLRELLDAGESLTARIMRRAAPREAEERASRPQSLSRPRQGLCFSFFGTFTFPLPPRHPIC